jgi:hypothetical protein
MPRAGGLLVDVSPSPPVLVGILLAGLAALADAGEIEAACRLAGQACVALRHTDQAAARRFDVLLHRLTPRLNDDGAPDANRPR